jgi:hypothetical protein
MTLQPAAFLAAIILLSWPGAIARAKESFNTVRQQFEARSVLVSSDHPRCNESNLFGLYVRGRQQVVVCPRGNQANTLLHEGWHLVQAHCLNGITYLDEEWLRTELSRSDRRDLDALYQASQWRREAEARFMANQPLDRYFAAFDSLCKHSQPTEQPITQNQLPESNQRVDPGTRQTRLE